MKSARPVVLDACVLVPMPLADTLLRLAAGPRLFLPKWSDQIMVEVTRTLRETFGLSDQKAMHRESEIRQHFPEAWIEDYEDLIPAMTNHPNQAGCSSAPIPRTTSAPSAASDLWPLLGLLVFGNKAVKRPSAGRYAHTL